MCGIFGYIGNKQVALKNATDIIAHRGPDAEGFLQYFPSGQEIVRSSTTREDAFKVAFGFRRLAIIDLKEQANQPFSDESDSYHVVFNGEIYNYIELRDELEKEGISFQTASDTEVLLKSYIHWGTACFQRFNGMWAMVILDIQNKKVICSRDRFGIKPFYYHKNEEGELFFASEIKQFFEVGVSKKPNENVIRDFIDKNIVNASDETFFSDIYELTPGWFMEAEFDNSSIVSIAKKQYWSLESKKEYAQLNFKKAREKFHQLFQDSIRLRFRSDVPVGSCLSGGLDSSSIVSVAAREFDFPIHTFTSRFDLPKYDESEYADKLAKFYKNVNSKYCQLDEKLFLSEMEKVLYHQDEPFGAMSILAQWEVMKLAKQSGVTVLLDGQGGDEQLAGYRKFYVFYLKEKLFNWQLHKFFPALWHLFLNSRSLGFFDVKEIKRYLGVKSSVKYFSKTGEELPSNANIGLSAAKTLPARSKMDIERFSFPPLLRFEDRNSMAFSIETRVPFMDYKLVEFLYSIPSDFKIRKGFTKYILRESLENVLPDFIRKRRTKMGFDTPQEVWMKGELNTYFKTYFSTLDNPYFDQKAISEAFDQYPQNGVSSDLFFRIYCFDIWYQKHFE